MDNWDEVRTAYQVARLGTVSGAAEALGVHHATVIRHIDALEGRLGVKLFQRHARGYTPTEAGQDLLRVAQATDDQFAQLANRIKGLGEGVAGELTVTSLTALSPVLTPVLAEFREAYPDIRVRFITGERVLRLEYGEAHVAIRAGRPPEEPDNVVQRFVPLSMRLAASQDYVRRHGKPETEAELADHWFVGFDDGNAKAPFNAWLADLVPEDRIVYRTSDNRTMEDAIAAGAGIGFMSTFAFRQRPDLVEVLPPREAWTGRLWLVTHVDLHRSPKVQAFLTFLKDKARTWALE